MCTLGFRKVVLFKYYYYVSSIINCFNRNLKRGSPRKAYLPGMMMNPYLLWILQPWYSFILFDHNHFSKFFSLWLLISIGLYLVRKKCNFFHCCLLPFTMLSGKYKRSNSSLGLFISSLLIIIILIIMKNPQI